MDSKTQSLSLLRVRRTGTLCRKGGDFSVVPPVVELVRASKLYRANGNVVYAVQEASLALEDGSFTAVVGRSGCGAGGSIRGR